jgi:predicted XRE-type DNA-binding protein
MADQPENDIAVTPGSSNVCADLGVAEPVEELAKAQLAFHIRAAIGRRKMTQARVAALMGLDQPKVLR